MFEAKSKLRWSQPGVPERLRGPLTSKCLIYISTSLSIFSPPIVTVSWWRQADQESNAIAGRLRERLRNFNPSREQSTHRLSLPYFRFRPALSWNNCILYVWLMWGILTVLVVVLYKKSDCGEVHAKAALRWASYHPPPSFPPTPRHRPRHPDRPGLTSCSLSRRRETSRSLICLDLSPHYELLIISTIE